MERHPRAVNDGNDVHSTGRGGVGLARALQRKLRCGARFERELRMPPCGAEPLRGISKGEGVNSAGRQHKRNFA
jgi:hypothetical protein